jgi:hypothetical protein
VVQARPPPGQPENAGILPTVRRDRTAETERLSFLATASSWSVPSRVSCPAVHSRPAQRPVGLSPRRFEVADLAARSAAVHTLAFTAAAPFFAAAVVARRLPRVPERPPTWNRFRHRHAAFGLTPNQCRSASALSVRIALASVKLTSRPDPPRLFGERTRGHGMGASLKDVTTHSDWRNRHRTLSPLRNSGAE